MELIEKFKRLPADSGVFFRGFEHVYLESRKSSEKKAKEFIDYCLSSDSPAIRVILGEWGEGKSEF